MQALQAMQPTARNNRPFWGRRRFRRGAQQVVVRAPTGGRPWVALFVGLALVYLSPTPPTYENEGSRGMVMPSHQKVRAAHGIDAWPSHVRQHVGSNRNNTSGSAQCLRRDSVNQSNGARAGCTWSHAQHLRRLCRGIQKRLFSRCSLALTATPPELLIMLAVFASIPVPQRFFCSALKIDGPTRHGPRR